MSTRTDFQNNSKSLYEIIVPVCDWCGRFGIPENLHLILLSLLLPILLYSKSLYNFWFHFEIFYLLIDRICYFQAEILQDIILQTFLGVFQRLCNQLLFFTINAHPVLLTSCHLDFISAFDFEIVLSYSSVLPENLDNFYFIAKQIFFLMLFNFAKYKYIISSHYLLIWMA